eukprot:6190818-Pleurochrysis_carterae.AAC.1
MVSGCDSLPGGIAAWLPSVCFILIEAHKEARQAATASRSQRLSPEAKHLQDADVQAADARASGKGSEGQGGSASTTAPRGGYALEADSEGEDMPGSDSEGDQEDGGDTIPFHVRLEKDLGISLASAVFLILRGFDRYVLWHQAIREQPSADDTQGREELALRCCITATRLMHDLENGSNSAHWSWMPHIVVYIVPLFVANRGNLWRFATAALESRGGRVKKVARSVISWQPAGVYKRTISKKGKCSNLFVQSVKKREQAGQSRS